MRFEARQHADKNFGCCDSVAKCSMAPRNCYAATSRYGFQAMVLRRWVQVLGQAQDAKGGLAERNCAASAVPRHKSQVKFDAITDDDGIAYKGAQSGKAVQNTNLPGNHGVGDAVDLDRAHRNSPARIDQSGENLMVTHLASRNADRSHGNDLVPFCGMKARGFEIDGGAVGGTQMQVWPPTPRDPVKHRGRLSESG